MSDLTRDFAVDLDIRSDGRTIHGIIVPYGQVARVRDAGGPAYDESFQKGAFAKHLRERTSPVKLLSQHDPRNPIGRSIGMPSETDGGLYAEFRISNTTFANEQLELARDGVLDAFSVGFAGVKASKRDGVLVRTEAILRETSLVTFPAYSGAMVAGVRAVPDAEMRSAVDMLAGAGLSLDQALALVLESTDGLDLTSLAQRLEDVAAGIGTPTGAAATDEPPARHSLRRSLKADRAFREFGIPLVKETA